MTNVLCDQQLFRSNMRIRAILKSVWQSTEKHRNKDTRSYKFTHSLVWWLYYWPSSLPSLYLYPLPCTFQSLPLWVVCTSVSHDFGSAMRLALVNDLREMTMCQFWAYALEALCVFHISICCPGNAMNVQTGLLGYKKHGIRQNHPSHPSQHPRMSVNLWDLGIVCYTTLSQQYITDTESQQCSFITHYYYLEWTIGSSGIWL